MVAEPTTSAASHENSDDTWQKQRMERELEWHAALYGEACDYVPSKLPISTPPVRYAA